MREKLGREEPAVTQRFLYNSKSLSRGMDIISRDSILSYVVTQRIFLLLFKSTSSIHNHSFLNFRWRWLTVYWIAWFPTTPHYNTTQQVTTSVLTIVVGSTKRLVNRFFYIIFNDWSYLGLPCFHFSHASFIVGFFLFFLCLAWWMNNWGRK